MKTLIEIEGALMGYEPSECSFFNPLYTLQELHEMCKLYIIDLQNEIQFLGSSNLEWQKYLNTAHWLKIIIKTKKHLAKLTGSMNYPLPGDLLSVLKKLMMIERSFVIKF